MSKERPFGSVDVKEALIAKLQAQRTNLRERLAEAEKFANRPPWSEAEEYQSKLTTAEARIATLEGALEWIADKNRDVFYPEHEEAQRWADLLRTKAKQALNKARKP
ncbi:MAG: hypothetical protein E2O29_01820 [Deltaproteobacteria bacterium]|nr:MAG: hypothetical protein E2O29_01820 [Deltaproteobacteria bacterium]